MAAALGAVRNRPGKGLRATAAWSRSAHSRGGRYQAPPRRHGKSGPRRGNDDQDGPELPPRFGLEFLAGPHAVAAAILSGSRQRCATLLLQSDLERPFGGVGSTDDIVRHAKQQHPGLQLRLMSRSGLDRRAEHHRGCILECSPHELKETVATDTLWQSPAAGRSVVVLDRVQDPQNLGAILRTCLFMGVDHILVGRKGAAPPTPTVSRVSSGALEYLASDGRLRAVHGPLPSFLDDLRDQGWRVLAADAPREGVLGPEALRGPEPTALVLGNEAAGVREDVRAACGGAVSVPSGLQGEAARVVDSLNVSAATAILVSNLVVP